MDSPPSTTTVPSPPAPAIEVAEKADPARAAGAGGEFTYTYTVTSTCNVTLTGITVTETGFTGSGTPPAPTCPPGSLAPGASVDCTATYTVTQADADKGRITNTATATGTPPSGKPPVSPPSTVDVPLRPPQAPTKAEPGISLTKTASPTRVDRAGQRVTYRFVVANTGETVLRDITVRETAFFGTGRPSAIRCSATTLAIGAKTTCTMTYEVTHVDVTAGRITNTAVAEGATDNGRKTVFRPARATVTATVRPSLTLAKTARPETAVESATIRYTFKVTNTGNVPVWKVWIRELSFSGTGSSVPPSAPWRRASP